MEQVEKQVAELAGARMPADRGLSGLGLLMQVSGSVFLAYGAYMAMLPILEGPTGGPRWQFFLIGVLSAIRSAYHRSAGAGLLYGTPRGHLHGVRVYIGVALAQSLAVVLLLLKEDAGTDLVLFVLTILAAWPVTLAIVLSRPRFKSITDLPRAEDMGFESAAVMMTLFGVLGAATTGMMLLSMFKSPFFSVREVPSLLWMGVIGMLCVRSLLHARAGLQGTMGVHADRASESASRYFNFGIVSSVIAGAILMLQMLMLSVGMHFSVFVMVAMTAYLLLIWPTALRNFFTDRNFSMLLDDQTFTRRAPDTGLTALGWILLALGSLGLSFSLGSIIFMKNGLLGMDMMLLSDLTGTGYHSPWWSVGIAGLQTYAGVELIRMSDNHRLVTTIYGCVAAVTTCYLWWPLIKNFGEGPMHNPMMTLSVYGQLIMGLTVAIASVLLVHRHAAPDAQARISE